MDDEGRTSGDEEEKHIEITIGEPIAEKIIDSCVGTDNRRYYKVCWQATWEPEDELLVKYQHLIGEYWKESIASHSNDSEQKKLINSLLENIMTQSQQQKQQQQSTLSTTTTTPAAEAKEHETEQEKENNKAATTLIDSNHQAAGQDILYFYKEVNSPEHKVSDQGVTETESAKKPPPLFTKKEEGPLPHKCEECQRSYSTPRKLKDHVRKLHINQGIYQCSECPKQFSNKRALQMHMNRHTGIGPHQCPGCKKRYMTVQELEFHKKSCNALVDKDYQCEHCSKRFATKTHLVFHMKIHLPDNEKPFKCQYCPRTFAYNHDCVHHMRLHVGEKPFQCDECDMAFHRKSYLTEHMFLHTGVSKYKCEECQSYFKTQQMLQTHVKNVHILKKEPKHTINNGKKTKKTRKKYKCLECDKEFRYVKEFHFHQMVNHKEKIDQQSDKEILSNFEPTMYYKCKKCDKTFRWMSVLKKHSETHKKPDERSIEHQNEAGHQQQDREIEKHEMEDDFVKSELDESETNSITVCYVESEKGDEINILACGHCMAGFTDEEDLNHHVVTEHADLITQAEVGDTEEIKLNVNQAQSITHVEIDTEEGINPSVNDTRNIQLSVTDAVDKNASNDET